MTKAEVDKILAKQEAYFNVQVDVLRRVVMSAIQNGVVSNGWCAEQAGMTVSMWRGLLKDTADVG